jgi:hypothetical protein
MKMSIDFWYTEYISRRNSNILLLGNSLLQGRQEEQVLGFFVAVVALGAMCSSKSAALRTPGG